jgi:hypothetical protein
MFSPKQAFGAAAILAAAGLGGCGSAPRVLDDRVTAVPGAATRIDVLANDSDPDGDPLQIKSAQGAEKGKVIINGDNTITYTPNATASGRDTFTYRAKDNRGHGRNAQVVVDITDRVAVIPVPVTPAPLATPEVIIHDPEPIVVTPPPRPTLTPAPGVAAIESLLVTLHTTDDDKNLEDPVRIIVRRGPEVLADRTVGAGEVWATDSDRTFEVMLRPPVAMDDAGLLTIEVRTPADSAASWAMRADAEAKLLDGRTLILLPQTMPVKLGGGEPSERAFTVPPVR